ncbi:MAG: DUF3187 family protein [Longimicrobiales bacterium]
MPACPATSLRSAAGRTRRTGRRPARSIVPAALAVGLAATSVAAAAQQPLGPLTSEDGSPIHRFSITPSTDRADAVATGRFSIETWLGWGNIFEQDSASTHELFVDLERLVSTTTVRYGVAPGVEAGVRMTFETTGGGILDGFLVRWHNLLRVGNANRERYPYGEYRQRLVDGRGEVRLDVPRSTLTLEDIRIFAKLGVAASADSTRLLSVKAVVRVPTRDAGVGGELTDLALMGLGRAKWGSFHIHGMAGGATLRAPSRLEGILRESAWFATLGVERPLGSRVSAIVQASAASGRLTGFGNRELEASPTILVFGAAGRFGDGWRWEASFQEDIPPDTPAVDFTLGLGLRKAF